MGKLFVIFIWNFYDRLLNLKKSKFNFKNLFLLRFYLGKWELKAQKTLNFFCCCCWDMVSENCLISEQAKLLVVQAKMLSDFIFPNFGASKTVGGARKNVVKLFFFINKRNNRQKFILHSQHFCLRAGIEVGYGRENVGYANKQESDLFFMWAKMLAEQKIRSAMQAQKLWNNCSKSHFSRKLTLWRQEFFLKRSMNL